MLHSSVQASPVPGRVRYRFQACAGLFGLLLLGFAVAAAEPMAPHDFDIPAQRADLALNAFVRETGLSALFPFERTSQVTTNAVRGRHTPAAALRLMFAGTGLQAAISADGMLVLEPAAASVAPPPKPARGPLRRLGDALAALVQGGSATPPPARDGATAIEEITITGTRLRRIDDEQQLATPVTAIDLPELGALAPGSLYEALNLMPQFLNNSGPNNIFSFAGAAGSSFLNLRGIGSNRTLVLIDGRRVPPSNRLGIADVALLPESMLRGAEVVTGGASAAYGSDAVSGVVNFLLDTDFTGIRGHVQGALTSRGDNANVELALALGSPLGARGHLLAAFDFHDAARVESYRRRAWYQGWGTVDVHGNGQPLLVASDVRSRLYTAGGLIRQPGSALDMIHFDEGGVPKKFVDGSIVGATRQVGGTGFLGDIGNKEADQTGQGSLFPDTRRGSAFLYLDYDFNDAVTGYAQLLFGSNRVNFTALGAHQETAPWQARIYLDNAFLPESIRTVMVAEGLPSFGFSRYSSSRDLARARAIQDNDLYAATIGFRGRAREAIVSGYYQYGRSKSLFKAVDFARLDRLYRATDAVRDTATGAIVCRSTLTFPDDGCVPANLFGPGAPAAEAIDYILDGDMWKDSTLEQHFAELTVEQDLFQGWGAGPITIVGGLSYREDTFRQVPGPAELVALSVPDAASQGYRGLPNAFVGDLILQFSGVNDDTLRGGFTVRELFAETLIPIWRERPWLRTLGLNAAARYADYSGSGGVVAWKAGFDWTLSPALRLRLTRSRDTRAATLAERFDWAGAGGSARDPLSGTSYPIQQISGGNPEVDPELADTWTAGVTLRPTALPGFSFVADWYQVNIKDYISQLGVQRIVDDCHAGATELCARITRDPTTHLIQIVRNVFLNVAWARVRGVDLEVAYQRPMHLFGAAGEQLDVRLFASHLAENSFQMRGVAKRDDAGTTHLPRWTATAILGYRGGPFTAALSGRFIDARVQFSDPVAIANQLDDNTVAAVLYTNLQLAWEFGASRGRPKVFLHVTNLFDRDPPVVANWSDYMGASPFPPGLHDTLGRRFTAGIEFEF
ncbi:MAG: TonB-dependent receptor [Gammaproteobacteria bacterium]|nr:TonB-dependent receptor [Gammaproteobacteria bacterium]